MNGFTKADNWLWDYVMPKARPNTFKVVASVVRLTLGWHTDTAVIKFDDFQHMTGIANRGTLNNAIEDAMTSGFIERTASGRSFSYSLKIVPCGGTKIVPVKQLQSKNRTSRKSPQSKNRTSTSPKIVPPHTSIKERKENIYIPSDNVATDAVIMPLIDALKPVSKEVYTESRHNRFDEAALTLFGWDATIEQISGFGQWWKVNGWHDDKPALKNILDSWLDYKNGSKTEISYR